MCKNVILEVNTYIPKFLKLIFLLRKPRSEVRLYNLLLLLKNICTIDGESTMTEHLFTCCILYLLMDLKLRWYNTSQKCHMKTTHELALVVWFCTYITDRFTWSQKDDDIMLRGNVTRKQLNIPFWEQITLVVWMTYRGLWNQIITKHYQEMLTTY